MKIQTINKVATLKNKGASFECDVKLFHNSISSVSEFKLDNKAHWDNYDLPELQASIKLGNRATLCACNDTDDLSQAIDRYLDTCIATTYIVGLELLSADTYTALYLDKAEFKALLMEYAKFDRESSKNAPKGKSPRRTLRLMMRTETSQRKALRDRA